MNAVVGIIEPAASISAIDHVHVWRSKFLDYSARCETRLRLLHHMHSSNGGGFLQIKALALAVKAEQLGCPKVTEAIDELLPLIELRAELAHSVVTLLHTTSPPVAVFINATSRTAFGKSALLLDQGDRDKALKKIRKISEQLKQHLRKIDPASHEDKNGE